MIDYLLHQKVTLFTILSVCFLVTFSFESCTTDQLPEEELAVEEEIINPLDIKVSANGDDGNVPANTLDNDLSTRWSSDGYFDKYITYDLGEERDVSGMKIAFYKGDQRKTYFKIRVGNSTSSLTTVYDAKNIGSSGVTNELEEFLFSVQKVRYVRISCFGSSDSSLNGITETQIIMTNGEEMPIDYEEPEVGDTPGSIIALLSKNWKLNGFKGIGANAEYKDDLLDALGKTFETYKDDAYFYTDGEWAFFKCYRGLGGSSSSNNPRIELRELDNGAKAYWDGNDGIHTMEWTVMVDQLPRGTNGKEGVLCFGQIHGPKKNAKGEEIDDVIRVQFRGKPDQTSGSVDLKISGYVTEKQGGSKIFKGYKLGTSYRIKIVYTSKHVMVYVNGNQVFRKKMAIKSWEGNYFKVGNYLQSVKSAGYDSSSFGLVRVKSLKIMHE